MSDAAAAASSPSRIHIAVLLSLIALAPLQAGRAQATDSTQTTARAETGTITGVVQDQATGAPLPGAQVTVLGARLGAEAGPDGRYTITGVPPGTYRVQVQLIGYGHWQSTVVVAAAQSATADFRLQQLAVALQEVVVVGYGTQVRRDVTGSMASMSNADVHGTPKVNAIEAMKGRIPGVDIVTTGNKPGDGVRVRLRGERSLKASNDPLYVLDGIPMAGGIGDLNPRDIESIEVLKDASATAIYGSRGANGVVLITTRHGRTGATNVTFDSYGGYQQPVRRIRVMNGPEFAEYKREANRARGQYTCPGGAAVCDVADSLLFGRDGTLAALRAGRWTDWQDLVLQEGMQVNNEIGITGGDERTRFALTVGQLNQDGIVREQNFERRSMRLNFDHELNERLRVGSSTSLIRTDQSLGRGDGVYSEALQNNPLGMAYDSAGRILFKPTPDGQRVNPLSDIANWKDQRIRTRLFGTLFADYNLTPVLNWRVNFGADLSFFRRGMFRGAETQTNQGSSADAGLWENRVFAYTLDNILTYRRSFGGDHRVDATLLYSIQQQRTEEDTIHVTGVANEHQLWYDIGSATNVDPPYSNLEEWSLLSVMTRFNYALKDRYLLTATARWDGSSRLAPGRKYGVFPSVAVAWRLSEESFVRRTRLFSDLKLRASYGLTGNTAIDPYQTQGALARTIYSYAGQAAVGYRPSRLPNPDLKWEQTGQFDVGLEFTALNNRLAGSIDYYRARTNDLLMDRQLDPSSGYQTILQNIGSTQNTGVEVALSALLTQDWHGLRWNVDLNGASNRNRIVKLSSGLQRDIGNGWFVGYPIQVYYDYQFGGIWQIQDSISGQAQRYGRKPGQIRVVDQNGDGKIDQNDRVILGSTFPRWTGSVSSRFDWKGIDLSVMAVARLGFLMHDEIYTSQSTLAGRYNNVLVDYWTPTNPSNSEPRPNAAQENPDFGGARAYEEGSFVRVRNITVGYTVPGDRVGWLGARSLRVYATALDPFLFTKFRGLDPESRATAGVPSYRTVMMGLTLGI